MHVLSQILLLSLGLNPSALAANSKGDLFSLGSQRKDKLYTFERIEKNPGSDVAYESTYKDLNGQVAVYELLQFKANKPAKYEMEQRQINAKGVVEFTADKLIVTYKQDDNVRRSEKPLSENTLVAPLITTFIRKNWTQLLKGEKLKADLYVMDRDSSYTFEYSKFKDQKIDGQDEVVVRMKPGNFIVAQLVDPLYFSFSPDGEKLLRIEGRTLPKKKVGEKWKDLSAEIVYSYLE